MTTEEQVLILQHLESLEEVLATIDANGRDRQAKVQSARMFTRAIRKLAEADGK